ncbi:ABC transporter substrate binding protein [Variovorax sp. YR216]|uniref:ABC transporter substrate binding protein n=1 Tax=Variovorax sp. YR216 TaxID=1882828 RepID=UPI000895501F|nr:ABC transporter substrate binding protein [Variovorax sp. YR216]SEB06480.1 putative ABC transport system substrate-binding protein [Variovorax sp. YR216]
MNQARASKSDAMLVLISPRMFPGRESLLTELRKRAVPAVFGLGQHVDAGGLASFGVSINALFERAAIYVAKVIQGEAPSSVPMEQPSEFDLVVNVKEANELGVKIPQSILMRATRVAR